MVYAHLARYLFTLSSYIQYLRYVHLLLDTLCLERPVLIPVVIYNHCLDEYNTLFCYRYIR
jgi:hypothetical protein